MNRYNNSIPLDNLVCLEKGKAIKINLQVAQKINKYFLKKIKLIIKSLEHKNLEKEVVKI